MHELQSMDQSGTVEEFHNKEDLLLSLAISVYCNRTNGKTSALKSDALSTAPNPPYSVSTDAVRRLLVRVFGPL